MIKIEIKTVKLSQIKLNPDNPRTITGKALDNLVKSLQEFPDMMNIREIVVDENRTILGGNMRFQALKKSGAKECTAKTITGLSPEQKRRFIISDNGSWGDWNMDELANKWGDLPLADWGVDLPEDWLKEPKGNADAEPQIDHAEELNKIWQVKPGDLWQIGEHRLLCGDSTKAEDVARVMGGEKAQASICDPPFNVREEAWDKFKGDAAFVQFTTKWLSLCKHSDIVAAFMADKNVPLLQEAADKAKWQYRRALIWQKPPGSQFAGASLDGYWFDFEIVQVFGLPSFKPSKDTRMAVMPHRTVAGQEHGCEKPLLLLQDIISGYTQDGATMFDPFEATGTTMVACQNLNRKCRGIEISPDYCAVILQRMTDAFPGIEIKRN